MAESPEDYELFHYGVKGMKWGVRKKYTESRDNRRAKKVSELSDRSKALRAEARSLSKDQKKNVKRAQSLERKAVRLDEDAKAVSAGKLTKRQKQVVVGSAVVAGLIVSKVAFDTIDSGELNRVIMKGRDYLGMSDSNGTWRRSKTRPRDNNSSTVFFTDALKVNPDYGMPGTKSNCRRATYAYEMRRRGYDVQATRSVRATGQNAAGDANARGILDKELGNGVYSSLKKVLKESLDREKDPSAKTPYLDLLERKNTFGSRVGDIRVGDKNRPITGDDVMTMLKEMPSGSRGEFGVIWKSGGGHSMAWEVFDDGPAIIDTQTRTMYKDSEAINRVAFRMKEAGMTRLDNAELNEDFLRKWVKNASG